MDKPALSLQQARAVIAAATAEAQRNGWRMVIAVVDDGGHLVSLDRIEDAQYGSVEVAIAKARASAAFRRPTKAFSDRVANGQLGVLTTPGMMSLEGGVPLMSGKHVVGAVGVSGATSEQDGQVAAAGAAALGA
jgi:glc operon protein GlcG